MELKNEQLDALEKMGANWLTVRECAIALEVDVSRFEIMMKNEECEAFKRYWKGRLNSKVKHVMSVSELAQRGSSPAQQMIQKMIDSSTA